MSAKIAALIVIVSAGGWIIYRKATHQPINPFDKNAIGAVQATPQGENAAEKTAESAKVEPFTYLENSASLGQVLQSALKDAKSKVKALDNVQQSGQGGLVDEVRKNALPAALGAGAAVGVGVLQKLGFLKGVRPTLTPLVKTSAGVVKSAATVKSPTSLAKPVAKTIGTQPAALRAPTVKTVPTPQPVTKAIAITGKTATAAAIDSTKALAGLKAAGRVAGRVVLPVAIGLSVYDAAERIQRKGAENFDVGDAVASASGLGGFGIRQYLPEWLGGIASTKFSEIPEKVAAALPPQDAARRAALLAARSRNQTKYRSGG